MYKFLTNKLLITVFFGVVLITFMQVSLAADSTIQTYPFAYETSLTNDSIDDFSGVIKVTNRRYYRFHNRPYRYRYYRPRYRSYGYRNHGHGYKHPYYYGKRHYGHSYRYRHRFNHGYY